MFQNFGNLKQLMFLDASNNNLESLPEEIDGCTSMADLHLTTNNLKTLPDAIGLTCHLKIYILVFLAYLHLTTNSPKTLPESIGLTPDFACLFVCLNNIWPQTVLKHCQTFKICLFCFVGVLFSSIISGYKQSQNAAKLNRSHTRLFNIWF